MNQNPQARRPGRKTNKLKFLHSATLELGTRPEAEIFLEPVDAVELGMPSYYDAIKQPMDMSTIRARLECNYYHSAEECKADYMLMFSNCSKFIKRGKSVCGKGESLRKTFVATLKQMPTGDERVIKQAKHKLKQCNNPSASKKENVAQIKTVRSQSLSMKTDLPKDIANQHSVSMSNSSDKARLIDPEHLDEWIEMMMGPSSDCSLNGSSSSSASDNSPGNTSSNVHDPSTLTRADYLYGKMSAWRRG